MGKKNRNNFCYLFFGGVWVGHHRCYICDNEVPYSTSTRLGQTVDYIKKQVCVSSSRLGK